MKYGWERNGFDSFRQMSIFPISKSLLGAYGWLCGGLISLDKASSSDMNLSKGQEWAESKHHPPTSTRADQEVPHKRSLYLTLIHNGSNLNFYLSLLGKGYMHVHVRVYTCLYMYMCRWMPEVNISVFLYHCPAH